MDKQMNRKRSFFIKGIVFFLILIALLIWIIIIPFIKLQKADTLIAEHDIEGAAQLYKELSHNKIWGNKAQSEYIKAMQTIAENAIQNHEFESAIEIYSTIGNSEEVAKTKKAAAEYAVKQNDLKTAAKYFEELGDIIHTNIVLNQYGGLMREANNYAEAIDAFKRAGNDEMARDTHYDWGTYLLGENDFDGAYVQFEHAGRQDKLRDIILQKVEYLIKQGEYSEICSILKPYNGADIAQLLFKAVEAEKSLAENETSNEIAYRYGTSITDVDTQLKFCLYLMENEYNLKEVYPNGVKVDVDLSKYQLYDQHVNEDEREPNFQKVLIFSRSENVPKLSEVTSYSEDKTHSILDDIMEKRRKSNYQYKVRLHPELIIDLLESNQAWDMESCTDLIILETGYMPIGSISIRTTTTSYNRFSSSLLTSTISYKIFPYYGAYSSIVVYDKENPKVAAVYNHFIDQPPASRAIVGNDYSDIGIDISRVQIEEIRDIFAECKTRKEKPRTVALPNLSD